MGETLWFGFHMRLSTVFLWSPKLQKLSLHNFAMWENGILLKKNGEMDTMAKPEGNPDLPPPCLAPSGRTHVTMTKIAFKNHVLTSSKSTGKQGN